MSDADEGITVTVTSKGQATIPEEFREKLHIDTPGRVRFVENDEGEILIRPIERPADVRGALAAEGVSDTPTEGETPATDALRTERERDERHAKAKFGAETDEE